MISIARPGLNGKFAAWMLICLAWAGAAAAAQPVSFASRKDYVSPKAPLGIVAGDFNGDMILDLAVTNTDSDTVSIFLGDPNPMNRGRFNLVRTISVGRKPRGIIAADFNLDRSLDLAVVNSQDHTVSILLGDGMGNFRVVSPTVPVGMNPVALGAGSFTGRPVPDLVVANSGSNNLSVLRGNGDGTFTALTPVAVGMNPQAVAVGFIDGDNKPDVAVANKGSNSVSILLGNGDGTFRRPNPPNITVGNGPVHVVLADFDGDGKQDLAVANFGSKTLSVLWGLGDGRFSAPQNTTLDSAPTALVAANFNRTPRADLAVAAAESDTGDLSRVFVFLSNANRTFTMAPKLSVGPRPSGMVAGDFDRDNFPDLAATSTKGYMVSVWMGMGNGVFSSDAIYPTGFQPVGVATGNFGLNRIPFLATANFGDDTAAVLLGAGDTTFLDPVFYALAADGVRVDPTGVAVADFNNDQIMDIAVSNAFNNTVSVLLGQPDGTFRLLGPYMVGPDPRSIAVGDINGDRIPDIVTANFNENNGIPNGDSISVLFGVGDGTFQTPAITSSIAPIGRNPRALVLQDVNFDGVLDVLTANFGSANVSVLLGRNDGTFDPPVHYRVDACGGGPHGIAIDDFNGDGYWDIVVGNGGPYDVANDKIAVLLGTPNPANPGTFGPPICIPVALRPTATVTGDFNGDTIPDIAVVNSFSNSVAVLIGVGDGSFRPPEFFGVGAGPLFLAPGNFGLDGRASIAVTNTSDNTVSVLINTTP